MNIRAIVKTRSSVILIVVLIVNAVYLISVTLQSFSTLKQRSVAFPKTRTIVRHDTKDNNNNKNNNGNNYNILRSIFADTTDVGSASSSKPFPSQPAAAQNLTLTPALLKKVDWMHQMLNKSRLAKDTAYPAMRIGKYIMLHRDLCSDVDRVHVIIIVHTAPKNLQRRQRIRETFGNRTFFHPFNVRVAFLLGKTLNTTLERVLWMEHARYNDTVMGDFIDDYHNLTLKGVMGYRWVSQYCANSEIVLKIDDDVFINTYKLLYSYMKYMRGKKKSIFCNQWHKNTKPIFRKGKWKVDHPLFPNMTNFPYDYCSGFIVFLSTDLVGLMHQAAMSAPFFWIDDVFLFGMLPSVVGDVTYYNLGLDVNIALDDRKAINCTVQLGEACTIFGSVISDQSYQPYWEVVHSVYVTGEWKGRIERIE